jgi:hypothetical protein
MTTFDERGKAFEQKFAHDEELRFKATVRRDKLFGLWAAKKLGLADSEAEAYAKSVVKSDFEHPGDEDILGKVKADLAAKGIDETERQLRHVLEDMMGEAVKQLKAEAGGA